MGNVGSWLWLGLLPWIGVAAAAPDVVLSGALTSGSHQSYLALPFTVPAGVDRIEVHFTYDREDHTTVDLGLEDPHRFRGWSGGNKDRFFVTETAATPSYLPGPLPAGEWRLVLGVPNIRQGVRSAYRAEIFFASGTPAFVLPFADSALDDEPGWYRGDLHVHSGHSDGACLSQSGRRVPCPVYRSVAAAADSGLDFIALTEHNARSQHQSLAALQPLFDRVVLMAGREITTFEGHFNVLGTLGPIEFRQDAGAALRRAFEQGGLVVINHPLLPSDERCLGCGWRSSAGLKYVHAVEVVNGGALRIAGGRADGPLSGVPFWESLLDQGLRVFAVAGSDNHDPGTEGVTPGAIGRPTTVIWAANLSQPALLQGLRAGRAFVDVDGSPARSIDLRAQRSSGASAEMGGVLHVPSDAALTVTVSVTGVPDGRVVLLANGRPRTAAGVTADEQGGIEATFELRDGAPAWVRAEALDAEARPVLLSNPIFLDR